MSGERLDNEHVALRRWFHPVCRVTDLVDGVLTSVRLLGEQWAVQAGIIKTANVMIEEAKKKQKAIREGIEGLLEDLGEDHKKMVAGGFKFNHIQSTVPPKEVKGYELDYWKITPPKKESTPS